MPSQILDTTRINMLKNLERKIEVKKVRMSKPLDRQRRLSGRRTYMCVYSGIYEHDIKIHARVKPNILLQKKNK